MAWKTAFRLAHLKRQRQILASGGEGNHSVGLTACSLRRLWQSDSWRRHSTTLHSPGRMTLPFSSSSRWPIWLSRPPSACSLVDAVARAKGTPALGTPAVMPGGGMQSPKTPHPGNYCWTHGSRISKEHTSATCANKATGHHDDATAANTFGGSDKDKGWDAART